MTLIKFPCQDLRTINDLWVYFSKNRFGFSVQKEIYEYLGGSEEYEPDIWQEFYNKLEWRHEIPKEMTIDNIGLIRRGPIQGFFPYKILSNLYDWNIEAIDNHEAQRKTFRSFYSLLEKLASCNIE